MRKSLLTLAMLLVASGAAAADSYTLNNGLQVVTEESHASPMVAAMVFVRAGSRFESPHINGATHFLEHLLFNGTAARSQAEIEPRIELFGGYINAFTRKEMTGYLVLMPREYIDTGLAVMSDMLFNSILPAAKVEKERGIVTEEIRRDTDNSDYQVQKAFDAFRYRGTPYARPVLGELNIIATISREEVLDYYQTWYVPNNMTVLVMGDFESAAMRVSVNRFFGGARPGPVEGIGVTAQEEYAGGGQAFETRYLEVPDARLLVSIPTFHWDSRVFPAIEVWVEYLNQPGRSPFLQTVKEGASAVASRAYISLGVREEGTELEIDLTLKPGTDSAAALAVVLRGLVRAATDLPDPSEIAGLVTAAKAEEYALKERLHYYGIMRAQRIGVAGWEHVAKRVEQMGAVTERDLRDAVAMYRDCCPEYHAMYVTSPPVTTATTLRSEDRYAYRVFPNGLTAIVKSNADSRMFGATVMFRNRSASEPPGREGIVDFCQRVLEHGAGDYDEAGVSRRLAELGASLTVTDNPYIPYDDFYTSPQFSFIKYKALDESASEALSLLYTLVTSPRFEEGAVEQVRGEMMAALGMQGQSSSKEARSELYDEMFSGGPLAHNEMGSPASIGRLTAADLRTFWPTYASPRNTILAVATGAEPEDVMQWIGRTFGSVPALDPPVGMTQSVPTDPESIVHRHREMDKAQIQIYIGRTVSGPGAGDAAAVQLMTRVLSERLASNLRETQGLAYSVGAGVGYAPEFGWLVCRMGTGADNYQIALDGMLGELAQMQNEPPTELELLRAKNRMRGRMLMRRLARENQCYYMARNELMGLGYDVDASLNDRIQGVTAEQVQEAARTFLSTDQFVLATVGRLPEESKP